MRSPSPRGGVDPGELGRCGVEGGPAVVHVRAQIGLDGVHADDVIADQLLVGARLRLGNFSQLGTEGPPHSEMRIAFITVAPFLP